MDVHMYACMCNWVGMDEYMREERMNEWQMGGLGGWMDGWMDAWMDGQMDG